MFFYNGRKGVYLRMKKFLGFIKKHKKAIIIIAILAVVAVVAINIVKAVKNAQNLIAGMQSSASTEEIEVRDIVNSVTATGTVVAVDKRTISSTVTGVKIKELNVEVGDQVQAGQILCLLDGENLETQLADAQKMLNADAGRTNIDLQSNNRGLNEAIEQRDISATRAEEDKNTAYSHVQSAANDCEEAKNKYDDATNKVNSAKDALNAAEAALENANAVDNSGSDMALLAEQSLITATAEFENAATILHEYVQSQAPDITGYTKDGMLSVMAIGNVAVSDLYTGDNYECYELIQERLSDAQTKAQSWMSAKNNLDSIKSNEAARQAAQVEVERAKANYEAALAQEESMKATYESMAKNVNSMWESFNNVVRAGDDSKRSNESAVASRVDMVKNSQLSSTAATLSDQRNIAQLQEQIAEEEKRAQELVEYEKYTKTAKYVEEVAKDKLGLVYEDEIIFESEDGK